MKDNTCRAISRLAELAPRYQGFVLDLWGVIHDGTQLYPQALSCLQQLKALNKPVIFLSNAPRRVGRVVAVLEALGVSADLYHGVISSGEAAYNALQSGEVAVGGAYFYIGPARDADVLDGLGYRAADAPGQADFVLNVGFGSDDQNVEDISPVLHSCLAHNLPMLCLNPDMEVVKISGARFACAGVIAKQYEALGGKVVWFGKPYQAVYARCMELLAPLRIKDILAVGDGLYTDILGANRAGMDSLLVMGGILQGKWQDEAGAPMPDFVMPEFKF